MNSSKRILLVDDELHLRETLSRILQRAGFAVSVAASARAGFDLLEQLEFHLVYMDIRMPDMTGLEMLKLIHAQYPDLPVILFTAQPDLDSALDALRGGAHDYLIKPLLPDVLIERANSVFAQQDIENRKQEITKQIDGLQAELRELEGKQLATVDFMAQPVSTNDRYLKIGNLVLDLLTKNLTVDRHPVGIPPTAFDYLVVLAKHSPNLVDYKTLAKEAQGYQVEPREAQEIVKWHVYHIRQAIESDPQNPKYLINVRGSGYRLVPE